MRQILYFILKLLFCHAAKGQHANALIEISKGKWTFPVSNVQMVDTLMNGCLGGKYMGRYILGVCKGVGENKLGKLLMKIREELIQQKQKIIIEHESAANNDAAANALSITPGELYEKMIAFKIKNTEYWIS